MSEQKIIDGKFRVIQPSRSEQFKLVLLLTKQLWTIRKRLVADALTLTGLVSLTYLARQPLGITAGVIWQFISQNVFADLFVIALGFIAYGAHENIKRRRRIFLSRHTGN